MTSIEKLRRDAMTELARMKQKAIMEAIKYHKTHRLNIVVSENPEDHKFIYDKEGNELQVRCKLKIETIKPFGWVCPLP